MSSKMKFLRVGVIGLGTMGTEHVKTINASRIGMVAAVCDCNPERIHVSKEQALIGEHVATYTCYHELIASGICDCIVVVTPHPSHLEIALAGFAAGLHVMVDKPITITVAEADQLLAAWRQGGTIFSTMYSMRTTPCNIVIREWIKSGRLGEIRRVEFTCTEWLRTQAYYDTQQWRGTWQGEGAGLLLNQAPHNLDLLFWWFGPAAIINAEVSSRFHNIETEDEVSARILTKSGIPIQFYSTTGEAPGKDYLEIVGTLGTLIRTGTRVMFRKLAKPLNKYIIESDETMAPIATDDTELEIPDCSRGHKVIFDNWFEAILHDRGNTALISPGEDGIHAIEWANAMLLSSVIKQEVRLPMDRAEYNLLLARFRSRELSL